MDVNSNFTNLSSIHNKEKEFVNNLTNLEEKTNTVSSGSQVFSSLQDARGPIGNQVRQISIESGERDPLDIEGIVEEMTKSVQCFRPLPDEGILESRTVLPPLVSSPLNPKPEIKDHLKQIDHDVYSDWKKMLCKGITKKSAISDVTITYDAFTHGIPSNKSFTETIKQLRKLTKPHQFFSIEGMAAKAVDEHKDLESIQIKEQLVQVSTAMRTDFPRGGFKVGQEAMHIHNEDGTVEQSEMEKLVGKMLEMGLTVEEVLATTQLYNQTLFNTAARHYMSRFPNMMLSGVKGSMDFDLHLSADGIRHPIIEGNCKFKITDKDPESVNPSYLVNVKVLVSNLGSADPDLANVHYYFSPIQLFPTS